jgi:hypothetical protein
VVSDQRLTAAREYLAYAQGQRISHLPHPVLQRVATELRRQLGQVLDVIGEQEVGDQVFSAVLAVVADGAGRLGAIRAVLARFDWETDDRQHALEEIDRIAGDEDQ